MASKNTGAGPGDRREPSAPMTMTVERLSVPDLESFMRRVFSEAAGQGEASPRLPRDYETALNLLQRASDAFPVLLGECEKLEAELRELRAQAQADLAAANQVTDQWHQLAMALKAKLEEGEGENALLRERLAAAEERLARDRRQTDTLEQQATVAIGITTLFHDKIVEAFGVGSPAHSTLDMIAKGGLDRRGGSATSEGGKTAG